MGIEKIKRRKNEENLISLGDKYRYSKKSSFITGYLYNGIM